MTSFLVYLSGFDKFIINVKSELCRDVEDVAKFSGVSHVHSQDVRSAADVLKEQSTEFLDDDLEQGWPDF